MQRDRQAARIGSNANLGLSLFCEARQPRLIGGNQQGPFNRDELEVGPEAGSSELDPRLVVEQGRQQPENLNVPSSGDACIEGIRGG